MASGTKPTPNKGRGVKATTGSTSATKVNHKDKRTSSKMGKSVC